MRKLAFTILVSAIAASAALAACGDDTSGTGGSGGTSTGTSTGSGATGGSGPGGNGSGAGTPSDGFCSLACGEAADCCADGVPDCPGDYPNNWSCDEGFCSLGGCATDEECTFGGALADYACFAGDGTADFCAEMCAVDGDCTPGANLTCTGEDADGEKYCTVEATGGGCEDDGDCAGLGTCDTDSGACICDANRDCTVDGYECKLP